MLTLSGALGAPRCLLAALSLLLCSVTAAQSLSVMTFNVRRDLDSDGADAWPERRADVVDLIRGTAPDLLGVQEALPQQMAYLDEQLPDYDYVGTGRRGEEGDEFSAIFYRRERLAVSESNTIWLSPTPDTVSLGWGARYPRIATYGRFRERETGQELFVLNTHLDHESDEARLNGLALITETIDALAEPGLPVVLMGDFNAASSSRTMRQLGSRYVDARDVSAAEPRGPVSTYVGFDGKLASRRRRIDYILVRRGGDVTVTRYAALTKQRGGRYLSDHLPVAAALTIGDAPDAARGEGYGRSFLETGSAGVVAAYSRSNGVGAFSVGPNFTSRLSRGFAIGVEVAYAEAVGRRQGPFGLPRRAAVSGVGMGVFGRAYMAGGKRVEPFLDFGPAVTFVEGAHLPGGHSAGARHYGPRG